MSSDQQPAPDVLTVEQFAERLQVSRATVFNWIQKNVLVQGLHFFKIGRVLRFVWNTDAVAGLLTCATPVPSPVPVPARLPAPSKRKTTPINFEY